MVGRIWSDVLLGALHTIWELVQADSARWAERLNW